MSYLFRRHVKGCPKANMGRRWWKCGCPVWIDDRPMGGSLRSLGTSDWDVASARIYGKGDPEKENRTIAAASETWLESHRKHAPETKRKYGRAMRYLKAFCEERGIQNVRAVTADTLDLHLMKRGLENWAAVKEYDILSAFFGMCTKRHWCDSNPMEGVKRPPEPADSDVVPFTGDELRRIISASEFIGRADYERLRARAMVLVMRFTGFRVSDVATLSREHLHGDRIIKRAHKNKRRLEVMVPMVVMEALAAVPHPKAAAQECKLIFQSGGGSLRSAVKGIERTLTAVFKRAGIAGAYPHKFRHSFCCELLGKGKTTDEVAALIGDTRETVERHYKHWTPAYQQRLDEAVSVIHGDTRTIRGKEKGAIC